MLLVAAAVAIAGDESAEERAAKQAELDAECEAARQAKLEPIRRQLYEECVSKQRKDPEFCRKDADSYNGARPGGGAPLFYDLPECEAAFEYRRQNPRQP